MITQFALRLICGMSITWCVLPRGQITSGFFRIQMLVTLGLAVLAGMAAGELPESNDGASATLGTTGTRVVAAGLAVLSFLSSVLWALERRAGAARIAFFIAGLSSVGVVLCCGSPSTESSPVAWLYALSEVSTATVSGAAVCGMLLGHWYLTAPSMSTRPLHTASLWLGGAAAVRLLLALIGLGLYLNEKDTVAATWSDTYSVWLSLEWLGGIIGPLVVCGMVIRILRYGNTQAATGVLFVGVILAFLGEMTAALLRQELAFPF